MHKWLRKGSGVFDRLHGGEAECVQSVTRKGTRKPSGKGVVDLEDCNSAVRLFMEIS